MREKQLLRLLYVLSFIEGGAVMGAELVSAKMIAPYFGNSLYVWASVLGVTLTSLMIGYLLGGRLSVKSKNRELQTFKILLTAGLWLCLMPSLSLWILDIALEMSIASGTIFALVVFLVPGLVLLSMTSPMIISAVNKSVETSGSTTGNIYSVSTLGGIIATFITGFYLLPDFGIRTTCYVFGMLLILAASFGLFRNKKIVLPTSSVLLSLLLFASSFTENEDGGKYKLLYESDGMLGQIKVIDARSQTYTRGYKQSRTLFVNNTAQTIGNIDSLDYSVWDWSYCFPFCVSNYPKNSKVLLMGLGGGTFHHQFKRLGYDIVTVELDQRIKDVAVNYFNVDNNEKIIIDDARHYINIQKEKFDIVTMDLFYNETPPYQALTLESFQKVKSSLNEDGLIMINFYGYLEGEKGNAARSLIKTLRKAGLFVNVTATPGEDKYRNLIILAAIKENHDYSTTRISEPGLPELVNVENNFINLTKLDFSNSIIFSDNNPNLEKMYLEAALEWRKHVTEANVKLYESGISQW